MAKNVCAMQLQLEPGKIGLGRHRVATLIAVTTDEKSGSSANKPIARDFSFLNSVTGLQSKWGLCANTSLYPTFNGSHFGLPPSEIHRMTGLPPKIV